jgi:hypothetical protein
MIGLLLVLGSWPDRQGPSPAGAAGLALALVTLAVLVAYQLRPPWSVQVAPGPVRIRVPVSVGESRHLYWATAGSLVLALGVVVVERIVVLT